ncbi:hypothetical protein L0244_03895 [bacterium]|nr:hypothetical protein [bacterium]
MIKRPLIVILTILAVAVVVYLKSVRSGNVAPPVSMQTISHERILYLFHNPKDQDEECRRIYAAVEHAEHELTKKAIVKRPDLERDQLFLKKYSIRVLPTILITSSQGEEEERFEGEGESVESAFNRSVARLKTQ